EAWKGRPEPDLLLADVYNRTNRPEAAEKALRDAWAKSGQSVEVELKLANFLADRRQFDAALQVLGANGADPSVVQQRLQTLLLAGRTAEAEAGVQQALAATPNSPPL